MGNRLERRAIQLGLQGEAALKYSREWIVSIEDISAFVAEQRQNLGEKNQEAFLTPSESVYEVSNPETVKRLQLW
jgi:hypothetical protein